MFDERTFISTNQEQWKRLSAIVQQIKSSGLRQLSAADLKSVGSMYRKTCSNLAYVRTQHATPDLVHYLNELVSEGHGVIYVEEDASRGFKRFVQLLTTGIPAALRRRMPFVLASLAFTVIGAFAAYELVRMNSSNLNLFVPPAFQDSFKAWKTGFSDHGTISAAEGTLFSSELMTHNIQVSILAFALGITLILPIYLMLDNGFLLGALIAVVQPTGHLTSMWAGLAPHGVLELSAIFIANGAGFVIAWALIYPGQHSRRDALIENGKDAVKMVIVVVPLLIVAGIIEGNVSHSSLPHVWKFSLAAVLFLALTAYIYAGPRRLRITGAIQIG